MDKFNGMKTVDKDIKLTSILRANKNISNNKQTIFAL
jgi:hypothetical protein